MDDNPFASPQTCDLLSPSASQTAELPSLARDGKLLVMHRRTELPPVCVKSAQPAEGRRIRKKLFWVHPVTIVFLIILLSPLICGVVLLFSKGVTREFIEIPLSGEWHRRRRRGLVFLWSGFISAAVVIFVLVAGSELLARLASFYIVLLTILIWIPLTLGCIFYGGNASHLLVIKRIKGDYVWLEGACDTYLDLLPSWPVDVKVG